MAQETPSRDLDKVIVRVPNGMRDALKADAAKNQRSMNAEIVARLEDYDRLLDTQEKLEGDVRELKGLLLEANRDRKHADMTAQTLAGRVETLQARNDELEQRLADVTQALLVARKPDPAPPPLTAEAFDKLFAEVRATREAVQAIDVSDLAAQVRKRMNELRDKPKEREEFMREMQLISRMVFE